MSPSRWNQGGGNRHPSLSPQERQRSDSMFLDRVVRWLLIALAVFVVLAVLGTVLS